MVMLTLVITEDTRSKHVLTINWLSLSIMNTFFQHKDVYHRWADCHILWSKSSPEFLKLNSGPAIVQNFKKLKVQVQNMSKKLTKCSFLSRKFSTFFPLTQSKPSTDPIFMNRFTVRIKSNIFRYKYSSTKTARANTNVQDSTE